MNRDWSGFYWSHNVFYTTPTATDVTSTLISLENSMTSNAALTFSGDSGGALLANEAFAQVLAGVTSYGICGSTSHFTNVASYRDWVVTTCEDCSINFDSPQAGDTFHPGNIIQASWITRNIGSRLRLIVRRNGAELQPPASTTIDPTVQNQDIRIPPEWGVGSDFEVCLASDIPAFAGCSPYFEVTAATSQNSCETSFEFCDDACANTLSDALNCGACGRTCDPMEVCIEGSCESSAATGSWTFIATSDITLDSTAEIRTKPDWSQRAIFDAFPTTFQIQDFDPTTQTLVVEWPATSPNRWLCHDNGILDGEVTGTAPDGSSWHGIPVDNGLGGCDIEMVR